MGLGGNLMWTGVIAAVARDGLRIELANQPKLSDLIAFRLYDSEARIADDPVFRGNPHVRFTPYRAKAPFVRRIDRWFLVLLEKLRLRRGYESLIATVARARSGPLRIHLDMEIYSYAARQHGRPGRRRFEWKQGGHAIATMLAGFGAGRAPEPPEIYLDAQDQMHADTLLREHGLERSFIAIEPETNREFFGDLRAWPFERWQEVARSLVADGHSVVQVGLPNGRRLDAAIDLRGRTDFRAACAVLSRARLFVGTESGLMHAARAVGCDAVIAWGGVTLPEFAGYPDKHDIVCKRVSCAPCGNLGWCENGHICMLEIETGEMIARVRARLGA